MASTKEIKNHINSVKDTQKITNAMYLISSTKLQKAKRELDHTRPFFNYTQKEIKRIFRRAPDLQSHYFYPSKEEERIIIRQNIANESREIRPIIKPAEIIDAQKLVEQIYVDEKIERYIVDIVYATRTPAEYGLNDLTDIIAFGASPRASISLARAARAYAFIHQRGYVIPEDVIAVCHDILRHRIGVTYEAEANNISTDEIITEILDKILVP